MIAGLGIDFNPPPSPPVAVNNPAIARLQGQRGLGRSLPTERDPRLNSNRPVSDSNVAALIGRKVRIVSAANVYHEQEPEVEEEHEYEDEREQEEVPEPEQADYDDEDILGDYTNNSQEGEEQEEYGRSSPAPTSHTMQSMHSLGAVSSGSSTRHREDPTMRHAISLTSLKAEEFEANLRNLRIDEYQPNPSLYQMHNLSYSVDNNLPPSETVATVRGNLPSASSAAKCGLRRTAAVSRAMSRPKSMMELSQLYAYQSIENSGIPPPQQMYSYDNNSIPMESRTVSSQSDASPMSVSTEDGYATSSSGGNSTAPSSVYGSTEMKPAAMFMARQQSAHQQQQCPSIPEHPSQQQYQGQPQEQQQQPASHQLVKARSAISMRSQASMRGLGSAETGGNAVVLDRVGGGFLAGIPFDSHHTGDLKSPPIVTDEERNNALARQIRSRAVSVATSRLTHAHSMSSLPNVAQTQTLSLPQNLQRQSTLLSAGANPTKRAKELERLLAPKPSNPKSHYAPSTHQRHNSSDITCQPLSPGGSNFQPVGAAGYQPQAPSQLKRKPSTVVLEQATKGKARVELDLVLASTLVVEGGMLKGRMEVRVRKEKDGEQEVWLGAVKARIVGFEELAGEDARHVFYHHSDSIEHITAANGSNEPLPCYNSQPDEEGFCKGKIGNHTFPFNMHLPLGKGAKGSLKSKQGIVKYIVIGSVKLKSHIGTDRSIAHFYRHVDVFPYLDPSIILAPSLKPIQAEVSKAMFMGGTGKVRLAASFHRSTWVAGQRCYVEIKVNNDAGKKIKTLNLSLIRTTTVFRPKPHLTAGNGIDAEDPVHADVDPDACQTQTTKKKVAETALEMGKRSTKGDVTAKGMWMGVDKGEEVEFCHYLQVPPDALSIERGRYLEVTYSLKVSVSGSLSSEVGLELPCRIVNFVSIDPPPGHSGPAQIAEQAGSAQKPMARSWSTDHLRTTSAPAAPAQTARPSASAAVTRMVSMDSLNITDLNRMYAMPGMSRGMSYDSRNSGQSGYTSSSAGMSRAHTISGELAVIEEGPVDENSPPLPSNAVHVVEKAQQKQMRHKMSLDCIGSAIVSATARRQGHVRMNSGLSAVHSVQEESPQQEEEEEEEDYGSVVQRVVRYASYPTPLPEPHAVQLDDLEDIPDNEDDLPLVHLVQPSYTSQHDATPSSLGGFIQLHEADYQEYEDESEDEVDLVLQTKHFESDEETENIRPQTAFGSSVPTSPSSSTRRVAPLSPTKPTKPSISQRTTPRSPAPSGRRSVPSSPMIKSAVDPDALRASGEAPRLSFGVASPASPVKKGSAPIISPRNSFSQRSAAQTGRQSLAPPSATDKKSPSMTSPRMASQARKPKGPVSNPSNTPQSVKGRVAALETTQVRKEPVVRKSASTATMRREASSSSSMSSGSR